MERAEKRELVSSLNQIFADTGVVVVTHYSGLSVAEMSDLRGQMREVGASFKVTKNRLTKLALSGTDAEPIAGQLTGPTAMGNSADPVAAPRILTKYAKKNDKLIIIGGIMGQTVLDADGVKALADLPSLDELRGKLVGLIQAPAQKLAAVTQAPAGQLARVFAAYAEKDAA